jgi:hypothetical protein
MGKAPNPHRGRLVLLVWILVAIFYLNLSYDYIRVSMHDDEFADYLQYVVQVAGEEQRPAKEVRQLILVKADDLDLPVRGEQITVAGLGQALKIAVTYDVDIQLPIFERGIYRKLFQHEVAYRRPGF